MNLQFRIMVLRLLAGIYRHQLTTLRIKPPHCAELLQDAEDFIIELQEKEKE